MRSIQPPPPQKKPGGFNSQLPFFAAQRLEALHAEGRLTPAQADVFMQPRAAEELYDLNSDPYQISNLVSDPGPAASNALQHLRAVMTRWQQQTGDTVQSDLTPADTIYETGKKIHGPSVMKISLGPG